MKAIVQLNEERRCSCGSGSHESDGIGCTCGLDDHGGFWEINSLLFKIVEHFLFHFPVHSQERALKKLEKQELKHTNLQLGGGFISTVRNRRKISTFVQ